MESNILPPASYQDPSSQSQSQGNGAPQASNIPPPWGQPATVTLMPFQVFRDFPVRTTCPACHADIFTNISYEIGSYTWMWCFIMGFFACCCCLPFFLNSCKDVIHSCPLCHCYIHRWNRSG